jgi:hypothetical protein
MFKFSDIEDALHFVSSDSPGMHSAYLCRETGKILYVSEMADIDELEDEEFDPDTLVGIPHQNELDLGQRLVFDYVETHLPDEYDRVRDIFRSRGAYGRFKDLLESRGLLESWYDFESQRQEQALLEWCETNKILLSD